MPVDQQEADRIWRVYDGQNGRYYVTADLRFRDGTYVEDVVFHGDTRIAVAHTKPHLPISKSFFGKETEDALVLRDRSGGSKKQPDATELDRQRFRDAIGD